MWISFSKYKRIALKNFIINGKHQSSNIQWIGESWIQPNVKILIYAWLAWLLQNESWISSEVIFDEKEKWDKTPEKMRWGKLTRHKTQRHTRKWVRGLLAKTRKREKLSLSHSSNFALALSWVEIAQNIRPRGDIKTFIICPLQGIFVIRTKHKIYVCLWYSSQTRKTNSNQLFSIFIPWGRFSSC